MSTPGVAAQDALQGQPATFPWAVLLDGLQSVGAAGGGIPALSPQQRGQEGLVKPYQPNEYGGEDFVQRDIGC